MRESVRTHTKATNSLRDWNDKRTMKYEHGSLASDKNSTHSFT
jgi:hypothetical protein